MPSLHTSTPTEAPPSISPGSLSPDTQAAVDRLAAAASSRVRRTNREDDRHLRIDNASLLTQAARDCVRRHPLASVGIAVGFGLALSSLLTRLIR